MKMVPWMMAGVGIGVVAYLMANARQPQYATGSSNVEDGAAKVFGWGAKQRVTGAGRSVMGRVKEGVGRFTGSPDLANEGAGDQLAGQVKDAAGQVAQAAGQTMHDLNR